MKHAPIRVLLTVFLGLCLLSSLVGCSRQFDFTQDKSGVQIDLGKFIPKTEIDLSQYTKPSEATERPQETSIPVIETTASATEDTLGFDLNTIGAVASASSNALVYYQPNPYSLVIGQLPINQQLLVTIIAHYGDITMACIGENAWVDLRSLLFEGCSQSGMFPCVIWGKGTNIRTGPGTEYPSKGSYDRYKNINITKIFYSNSGEAWGKMTNGNWVCIEFVKLPDGLSIGFGNNANVYIP